MTRFILHRLAALPVTALLAAAIVFALLRLAPGDPASALIGENATPRQIQQINQNLGLDQPLHIQLARWTAQVAQLNLGNSLASGHKVSDLIAQRLPATLSLAALAFVLSIVLALPLLLATGNNSAAPSVIAAAVLAVPVFIWGYALVWGLALALDWFPAQGWPTRPSPAAALHHLALPAVSLALVQAALILRLARPFFLAGLAFLDAARARGESGLRILVHHRLRAALPALLTAAGLSLATLLGGVVVTESVFHLPGVGRLVASAALNRDYPVVQGVVLLLAAAVIVLNLVIDILVAVADPRLRHGARTSS
ncbi:MAG: ABC transporter permease [Alphaproteobacteria bacterium]|nr:ABC transporter permease [Alphaproteobacteria bacterium]MDA8006243.1 ABC transporter permease [Alphaproteobacteria bacterium]MDA8013604.1 ABC transporter permease [Alphaproteobacteria bacterium]